MRQPHGLFGWVDVMSSDVEAARTFYESLFGWTSTDMPTPMGPNYTLFRKDGKLVSGMGPLPPDMASNNVPSTWSSYVLVESVDDIVERVTKANGSIVMPAMDIMSQGRMAMVADTSGAVFGLWQPNEHQGAEVYNVPGALTWNELHSRDLTSATAFYSDVFGWRWEPMDGSDYLVGHLDAKGGDDTSNCGAMTMPGEVPAMVPSNWMVYIAVEDCDASLKQVKELHGDVFQEAMDMGPGRMAGITDPTGARLMIGSFPST